MTIDTSSPIRLIRMKVDEDESEFIDLVDVIMADSDQNSVEGFLPFKMIAMPDLVTAWSFVIDYQYDGSSKYQFLMQWNKNADNKMRVILYRNGIVQTDSYTVGTLSYGDWYYIRWDVERDYSGSDTRMRFALCSDLTSCMTGGGGSDIDSPLVINSLVITWLVYWNNWDQGDLGAFILGRLPHRVTPKGLFTPASHFIFEANNMDYGYLPYEPVIDLTNPVKLFENAAHYYEDRETEEAIQAIADLEEIASAALTAANATKGDTENIIQDLIDLGQEVFDVGLDVVANVAQTQFDTWKNGITWTNLNGPIASIITDQFTTPLMNTLSERVSSGALNTIIQGLKSIAEGDYR